MNIAERWQSVAERVAAAARRSGRDAAAVRIVAVSKTKSIGEIAAAVAAGASDVGENYVQEAAPKIEALGGAVRWHMIGHLQRNKAAKAAALFDVVQTVDSAELGRALARHAAALKKILPVLVEVNMGSEASKSGVPPEQVESLIHRLAAEPHLRLEGLMTIPPPVESPQAARPYFAGLRELRDRLASVLSGPQLLRELSMGMTDDFEVAIEEGATIVRIGRAIFGERTAALSR